MSVRTGTLGRLRNSTSLDGSVEIHMLLGLGQSYIVKVLKHHTSYII